MRLDGRHHGMWHRGAVVAVLVLLVVTLIQIAGLTAAGAEAASRDGERSRFADALNRSRSELAGAAPLRPAADLDAVADRHALAMAERGKIFHNPALHTDVARWEAVGENVGVGPDLATLHGAFLDSPAHRTNLLDGRYLEVGIGLARRGGHLWVVEVFRRALPTGAIVTSDPAPAPVVPDAGAPAPASAPAAAAPADAGGPSLLRSAWGLAAVLLLVGAVPTFDRAGGPRRPAGRSGRRGVAGPVTA